MLTFAALAAILSACIALTAPAASADPADPLLGRNPGPGAGVWSSAPATVDTVFQLTDAAGNALGAPLSFSGNTGLSVAESAAAQGIGAGAADRTPQSVRRARGDWGAPSYSGCAWIEVTATKYSLLGFTAFKYHVRRNWCWNLGHRVTSVSTEVPWFTSVDSNGYVRSVSLSPHGWFYGWCCGDPNSGHYAFRQGHIDNCVLKYGCLSTYYPTIEIYVHGNGTAHWAVSGV